MTLGHKEMEKRGGNLPREQALLKVQQLKVQLRGLRPRELLKGRPQTVQRLRARRLMEPQLKVQLRARQLKGQQKVRISRLRVQLRVRQLKVRRLMGPRLRAQRKVRGSRLRVQHLKGPRLKGQLTVLPVRARFEVGASHWSYRALAQ